MRDVIGNIVSWVMQAVLVGIPASYDVMATETLGWRPTCHCGGAEPIPAIVLDPFGGAGTVGLVASQEKRDYLLIEKKPDYVAMAERRIAAVETAVPVSEGRNGQQSLFEIANRKPKIEEAPAA
jgi:hypothetical protein